jgi:hypothetical protein
MHIAEDPKSVKRYWHSSRQQLSYITYYSLNCRKRMMSEEILLQDWYQETDSVDHPEWSTGNEGKWEISLHLFLFQVVNNI